LHDEIRLTSVFVTHDQEEALEVSDRVVVMNKGHVEQVGSPQEVFDHPKTAFVMNFLGQVNALPGGFVRPHELDVARQAQGLEGSWASVRHVHMAGAVVKLELVDESQNVLLVEMSRDRAEALGPRVGDRLFAWPRRLRTFEPTVARS